MWWLLLMVLSLHIPTKISMILGWFSPYFTNFFTTWRPRTGKTCFWHLRPWRQKHPGMAIDIDCWFAKFSWSINHFFQRVGQDQVRAMLTLMLRKLFVVTAFSALGPPRPRKHTQEKTRKNAMATKPANVEKTPKVSSQSGNASHQKALSFRLGSFCYVWISLGISEQTLGVSLVGPKKPSYKWGVKGPLLGCPVGS